MRVEIEICDVCRKVETRNMDLTPLRYIHPISGYGTVEACPTCHDAVADVLNEISIKAEEEGR